MQLTDGTIIIRSGFNSLRCIYISMTSERTVMFFFLKSDHLSDIPICVCVCVMLHFRLLCVAVNPVLCSNVEIFQLCEIFLFFFHIITHFLFLLPIFFLAYVRLLVTCVISLLL